MERLSRLVSSLLAASSICTLALAVVLWPGVVLADDDPISPGIVPACACTCGGSCATGAPILIAPNQYSCVGTCTGGCNPGTCDAGCGCNPQIDNKGVVSCGCINQ